jgi:hypothetical protein
MDERRQAARLALEIPGHAKVCQGENCGDTCQLITKDVSEKGAYFYCKEPFPLATELKMILKLGKRLGEAIGQVVRVDDQGMAVYFQDAYLTEAG